MQWCRACNLALMRSDTCDVCGVQDSNEEVVIQEPENLEIDEYSMLRER